MADFYSGWHAVPNGGAKYRLKLSVALASQDIAGNKSFLDWALIIQKDRSYQGFYDYWADWSVVVDGSTVGSGSNVQNPTAPWTGWKEHVVDSGRVEVAHGTTGTKSVAVSGSWQRTGGGAAFEFAPGPMSVSSGATPVVLTPILRATQPSVSPSPASVGADVTIDLPRSDVAYTHDVVWSSGTLSGVIGTGLGESTVWTVPDVMAEFPGRATAPITITATTKNGAAVLGSLQTTLLARNAPSPPVVTPANPDRAFDIRARLVTWDPLDSSWGPRRVIPAESITLVDPSSATATCTITLSKLQAADFADYSVVDIDVFDGNQWVFTDHRFVLSRVEGDLTDPSETYTYSGTEYVDFILGAAYLQEEHLWDGSTNHAPPSSPGEILGSLIYALKLRGWGPRIGAEFDGSKTSLGDPWVNPAINRTVSAGTPLLQVLEGLVNDGLVEYRAAYHDDKAWLVLLNPGTGLSFAAAEADPIVNLSLANLSRAPRRGSIESRLTRVTVVGDTTTDYGDKGTAADNVSTTARATRERAPFDADVFGHLEGWVAASGVATSEEAGRIGDNALRDNAAAVNERTFEFNVQDVPPHFYPYVVYTPGDWVLTPGVNDEPLTDRVSQVTVSMTREGKSVTVLTGDRILSGTASLAKRQAAQTGGAIAGGNGGTLAALDARIPSAPEILDAVSAGYWTTDGTARSEVTLSWGPVTAALNSSVIAVDLYEVWWREAVGGVWKFRGATGDSSIELSEFDVLQDLEFRVRARSAAGVFGEFSENIELTTLAPPVDLDGPVISDLYTDGVGSIYIVWGGLIGAESAPMRLAYVGAELSSDGGLTYAPMGTPIPGAGAIIVNPHAWGEFSVRLRGYDRLGNPGDASDPQTITLTDPGLNPQTPLPPTGLTVTPGAGWDASGFFPIAWFDIEWDAPTLDVDGAAVDIAGYDIWGKRTGETELRFLTSTTVPSVRYTVADGEEWTFQVRAVSSTGGLSDLTGPVVETADAAVAPAPAPDAPTLAQYAGLLRINWSGGGMLPQIKYVYAAIATSSGGTFVRAGMPLNGPGEVVVPGLAPGNYWAKIVMVDERGQTSTSPQAGPIELLPITGVTIQTSPVANTGIKITDAALTAYDVSGNPSFILDAATGEVWIAPYDAVFEFGADGIEAETGNPTVGVAISSAGSSFNTFIHPSGVQIRNDQTPLSWWEADATDTSLVNFVSPRARVDERFRIADYEMLREAKSSGSRLVIRYKGV